MDESVPSSLLDESSIISAPMAENLRQFNDAQLREIYENEEIERFLRLFSTVREFGGHKNQKNQIDHNLSSM